MVCCCSVVHLLDFRKNVDLSLYTLYSSRKMLIVFPYGLNCGENLLH